MKKNTPLGKVLFWAGFFLFFILGMSFNESLGWIQDAPGFFSSFSIPAVIIGIVLIVISNFFVRKEIDLYAKILRYLGRIRPLEKA